MKVFMYLLFLIPLLSTNLSAQYFAFSDGTLPVVPTKKKSVNKQVYQVKGDFWNGVKYVTSNGPVTKKKLESDMIQSPITHDLFRKGKGMMKGANYLGLAGAAVMIFPIAQGISTNSKPDWSLFGAGAGLFSVATIIHFEGKSRVEYAFDMYNGEAIPSHATNGSHQKTQVDVGTGQNGIGIKVGF